MPVYQTTRRRIPGTVNRIANHYGVAQTPCFVFFHVHMIKVLYTKAMFYARLFYAFLL
jgi:hypothetical protein